MLPTITTAAIITTSGLLATLGWVMTRDSMDEYGQSLVDQDA